MAITYTDEWDQGEFKEGSNGTIEATLVKSFELDSNTDPEAAIIAALPFKGSSYSASFPGLLFASYRLKPIKDDNKYVWNAFLNYTSEYNEEDDQQSPLAIPTKYQYSSAYEQLIIYKDVLTGDDIKNSAKEQTPIITRRVIGVVTVIDNIAAGSFSPGSLDPRGTTNDAAVNFAGNSFAQNEAFMADARATETLFKSGVAYVTRTLVIHYNPLITGWKRSLLNQGKRELIDAAPTYRNIKNPVTKQDVTSPWPLDADGKALDDPGGGVAVFTFEEWSEYEESDWSGLV